MARVKRKTQKIIAPQKKGKHLFVKGDPRAGRPLGSKNKFTDLRNAFLDAFNGMGGAAELQRWGTLKKNRATFYNMIAKMLPKEMILTPNSASPEELPFTVRIESAPPKGAKS